MSLISATNLETFLRTLEGVSISVGEPKRNKDYHAVVSPKRKSDATESLAMARFAVWSSDKPFDPEHHPWEPRHPETSGENVESPSPQVADRAEVTKKAVGRTERLSTDSSAVTTASESIDRDHPVVNVPQAGCQ